MLNNPAFLHTWLRWFILILSGLTALLLPLLHQYEKGRVEVIREREQVHLTTAESVVKHLFDERIGDIRMLAHAPSLPRYLEGEDEAERAKVVPLFLSFCRAYGLYDQIRLIRLDGQELVRVNQAGGQCVEVPRTALQNKVNRYYFKEASQLPSGQVFVSPLDLNVEHGKVEEPHKPMIRFATPALDGKGAVKAVLVLNYLAKNLVVEIFPHAEEGNLLGRYHFNFLLNAEGYYLKSQASPDREFAFMFGRDRERFGRDYPEIWQAIRDGRTSVRTEEGLFLANALPVPISPLSRTDTDVGDVSSSSHWYAVHMITNPSLMATSVLFGPYRWVLLGLYLLTIAGTSALWAERRLRRRELIQTTKALKNTMAGIEHAGIDVHWVDFETGRFLRVNNNTQRLLGYSEDELLGKPIWEIDRNLSPEGYRQIRDAIRARGNINFETLHNHRDGGGIPVEVSIAYRDPTPDMPAHFVTMSRDITQRKAAEQERQRLYQENALILSSVGDGIYGVDLEGTTTFMNPVAEQMLGWTEADLKGRRSHTQLHHSRADGSPYPEAACPVYRSMRDGRPQRGEREIYWRKDGTSFPVSYVSTPMFEEGKVTGAVVVFRDDTERLAREAQLTAARQEAERANTAKSRFLATMSHEIRTPLNAIIGMVHLLRQDASDPLQLRDLSAIQTASGHLLDLINDILDFSKIEAGELTLDPHDFFLPGLFQDLEQLFSANAGEKGLSLEVRAPAAGIPTGLYGDGRRLKQMLVNLLGNAIKFTDAGKVGLTVGPGPGTVAQGQVQLRFEVEDTGKGIAPEARSRLFHPFSQEDSSTTRQYGGTGLGLSIVHRLAQLMGGSVGLESEPGRGSTFWLELPFAVSENAVACRRDYRRGRSRVVDGTQIRRGRDRWLAGVRLLLVDDSPINLEVTGRILEIEGASATPCAGGRKAVEALEAEPDGYDLVLMDLQMPGMDGVEATRAIRQRLGLALPVIALTAGATTTERERAGDAGMDDFLTKPLDPQQLVQVIRRYVKRVESPPPPTARQPDARKESAPAAPTSPPTDLPAIAGIDRQEIMRILGSHISLFPKLLDVFLTENTDVVTGVQALLDIGDTVNAAKRIHKTRGQAANIGALSLRAAAEDLENTLKSDTPDWNAPLQAFSRAHRELVEAVAAWRANRVA